MSSEIPFEQSHETNRNGLFQNQAEKRAHHNALERKRRDFIKESFNELRDVIPLLKGEKASRAHVLKSATEYVRTLRKKNHQNQTKITDLKRENEILESQIRLLERLKDTSLYAKKHQDGIKIESDIQITRNLLN